MELKSIHKKIELFVEKEIKTASWKKAKSLWLVAVALGLLSFFITGFISDDQIEQLKFRYDPIWYAISSCSQWFLLLILVISTLWIIWKLNIIQKSEKNFLDIFYGLGIISVILPILHIFLNILWKFQHITTIIHVIIMAIYLYFIFTVLKIAFRVSYSYAIGISVIGFLVLRTFVLFVMVFFFAIIFSPIRFAVGSEGGAEMINNTDGSFTMQYYIGFNGIDKQVCEISFPKGWKAINKSRYNWIKPSDYMEFVKTSALNETVEFNNRFGGVVNCPKPIENQEEFFALIPNDYARVCGVKTENRMNNSVIYDINYDNVISEGGYSFRYQTTIGNDQDFFYIINNTDCHMEWYVPSIIARFFFW